MVTCAWDRLNASLVYGELQANPDSTETCPPNKYINIFTEVENFIMAGTRQARRQRSGNFKALKEQKN